MESYKVTTYKYNNTEIKDVKIVKSKVKKKVINKFSNVNIVSRDKFPKENYLCWVCEVNKDDCVCNEFNNIFRNYNVEESDKKIYNCYECKRTLENCICYDDDIIYCKYGCGVDLNKEYCMCE